MIRFDDARFSGSEVNFGAEFRKGLVTFYNADFSGGTLTFDGGGFTGADVMFGPLNSPAARSASSV